LAEWIFEAGIGEDRAALIEDGEIVEMLIDRHDGRPREGAIMQARLISRVPNSDRSILSLIGHGGKEAVGRIPARFSEGEQLLFVIVREAIPERGNPKPPVVKPAEAGEVSDGPSLATRLRSTGHPVLQLLPHTPDRLEALGWSDRLVEAESGLIPFDGGLLRMSLTPAMTLFDVDGGMAPDDLSVAGAAASARATRLFDIGGSIGIDLPVSQAGGGKVARQAAAERVDALLPQPFERTAVNGFGFLQIVRRRARASIPELLQSDPVTAAALALLRRAERASGRGALTLSGSPAVIGRIAREEGWQEDLARRRGAIVHLSGKAGAAISETHVQTEHP
jgi:hypothetical protein